MKVPSKSISSSLNPEFYRLLLDSAPDAIITTDGDGSILDWNQRAEEMFGYQAEEAVGNQAADLIFPERLRRAHRENMARILASGTDSILPNRKEMPALRRDGAEFWVDLGIAHSRIEGRWIFCFGIRDISRRKAAEHRNIILGAVTSILSRSPELPDAITEILEAVCSRPPWVFGAFWRHSMKDGKLHCRHLHCHPAFDLGPFAEKTRALTLEVGQGLPGRVSG